MKLSKKKKRLIGVLHELDHENRKLRNTLAEYGYRSMVGVMKPNAREVNLIMEHLRMMRLINATLTWVLTYSQSLFRDPRRIEEDNLPF